MWLISSFKILEEDNDGIGKKRKTADVKGDLGKARLGQNIYCR